MALLQTPALVLANPEPSTVGLIVGLILGLRMLQIANRYCVINKAKAKAYLDYILLGPAIMLSGAAMYFISPYFYLNMSAVLTVSWTIGIAKIIYYREIKSYKT